MKYIKLRCANFSAYVDYLVYRKEKDKGVMNTLVAASLYNRSFQELKAVTANLHSHQSYIDYDERTARNSADVIRFKPGERNTYKSFFTTIPMNYEKVSHATVYTTEDKDKYIYIPKYDKAMLEDVFYEYLMNQFDLPLLREWSLAIFEYAVESDKLDTNNIILYEENKEISLYGKNIFLSDIEIYYSKITTKWLDETVTRLLQDKAIRITDKKQNPLLLTSMGTYFDYYGKTIVDNLKKTVRPLVETKGSVDYIATKSKKLFPQQANIVNGLVEHFSTEKAGIINAGMGTGKSILGASTVEAFFVKKYLMSHPNETLKDVYMDKEKINYRVIIMAPGHLIEKWQEEVKEIPYAKAIILTDFKQLVDMKKQGKARNGREFYIIGKDFCKLSYLSKPVPSKIATRTPFMINCRKCGEKGSVEDFLYNKPCSCGSTDWEKTRERVGIAKYGISDKKTYKIVCSKCEEMGTEEDYEDEKPCSCGEISWVKRLEDNGDTKRGLICPECGEVLSLVNGDPLLPSSFAEQTDSNSECNICGCYLWDVDVRNIDTSNNHSYKQSKWHKVTHFANKARKTKKTAWVLQNHEEDYFASVGIKRTEAAETKYNKCRKYAPSQYIKKQLKGFFDFCVLDELHLYKGEATGNGSAMHAIIKSSKKVLGLTGTLVGGLANHLYYILYRLKPSCMKKMGFDYQDEMKFIQRYGTTEVEYILNEDSGVSHNASCKGKRKGNLKIKPGISPLVFADFLIDKTVFLDITEMSNDLPELEEEVICVPMIKEHRSEYQSIIERLKGGYGINSLSSSMLLFSLAYPDKPFDYGPIIDPKDGTIAAKPKHFDMTNELLPKEEKLVDIISEEVEQGRNVFVYCEYTGDGFQKITDRIKQVIEDYCGLEGKVQVIESSSPAASKREQWIHKKASEGIKVFICNPKVCETGLDFRFSHDGKIYNYPTLVFLQMGTNLFTIWQASYRHYRLNQTEKCKTYYLCYQGTNQEKIIELMANKMVASKALSGKFSSEGLAALANGIDPRVALLNSLMNDSYKDELSEEITKMFSNKQTVFIDDNLIYGTERTKLLKEVIGEEIECSVINESGKQETLFIEQSSMAMSYVNNLFNIFEHGIGYQKEEVAIIDENETLKVIEPKKKKNVYEGQQTLFSFFN